MSGFADVHGTQYFFAGVAPAWSAATGTASVAENSALNTAITVSETISNTPVSVAIQSTTPTSTAFSVALNAGATGVDLTVGTANQLDRETTASYVVVIR